MLHNTSLWFSRCWSMIVWMLKWSLSVPLGSLTVWACSFPNIAKFQFLHQADRDNYTVKNLHSWLSEMTFPFLRIRKATTLVSQWLISRNLGGSIAKKKKKKSRPMLAASTGPILSKEKNTQTSVPWVSERVEQLFQTQFQWDRMTESVFRIQGHLWVIGQCLCTLGGGSQ